MDQSEKSQQQSITDSADQMGNTPPPLPETPDVVVATSSNVSVPVLSSTMQPPLRGSTTQHQLTYPQGEALNPEHVRERLRLLWANQMQEMEPADLKKNSLPLSRVKKIMKAEICNDVKMVAKESTALLAKACEMLILDMTSQAWINTDEEGRRIVKNKDIAAAIHKTDIFDFLEIVLPREESREQILKATNDSQQAGSSTGPIIPRYNVPDQQHGVGVWNVPSAGGQQPSPFMPLYQPWPQNQQSSLLGPQAQSPQIQQQTFMPWPQDRSQQNQQQLFVPWHQARYQQNQQQLFVPRPQAQYQHNQQQLDQHILEQPNMSWTWTQAEFTPDQQIPEQPSPSLPQAEHEQGQKQNDEN